MANNTQLIDRIATNYPAQPFSIDFRSVPLTDEQFEELCCHNSDLKFELTSKGELIIVPPTSPESGWKNTKLTTKTEIWSEQDGTGIVFDSSTMFTLPNGAKRSPDVSWMPKEKWEKLSPAERNRFSRIVPDFVIELRSPSDHLNDLQDKMREYIENGVRLGWLIDPENKTVHVYRKNGAVEILENPETVSGENVLTGFELNVREIW